MSNDDLYDDDSEFVPPTEEELRLMEEKRKKSDLISAELGRRMLLGWGLMGTSCPSEGCFTPLMKEPKTSKLFCVNCNVYVIPEEEYDPSRHKVASSSPTATQNNNPMSSPAEASTISNRPNPTPPVMMPSRPVPSAVETFPSPKQAASQSSTTTPPDSSSIPTQNSSQPGSSARQDERPPRFMMPEAQRIVKTSFELLTARLTRLNNALSQNNENPDTLLKAAQVYEGCANAMTALVRLAKELSHR